MKKKRQKIATYGRWNPVPDDVKSKVVELYSKGLNATVVGSQLGIARNCIASILKEKGVSTRLHPNQVFVDDSRKELIAKFYESGKSVISLEKKFLLGEKVIYNILKEKNVHIRRRNFVSKNHAEEIVELYSTEKKTCKEISELFGVDYTRIWQILKESKVKIRKYKGPRLTTEQRKLVKFKNRVRSRILMAFRKKKLGKKPKSIELLGADWAIVFAYIESQFTKGMTWEKHGIKGFHIDHIVPLASAATKEELTALFHYTNLRPIWAKENLKKSSWHNGVHHSQKKIGDGKCR